MANNKNIALKNKQTNKQTKSKEYFKHSKSGYRCCFEIGQNYKTKWIPDN